MTKTTENIIKAIQNGTDTANKNYEKCSHGWWLADAGVEREMVVGLAEALNEIQQNHESLRLEPSAGQKLAQPLSRSKQAAYLDFFRHV